jgi:hypothetical protein
MEDVDDGHGSSRSSADEDIGGALWSHRVPWTDLIVPISVERGRAGLHRHIVDRTVFACSCCEERGSAHTA